MKRFTLAALALLAACGAEPAGDPAKPESYAVQLAVEPAAGDGLQRLALPAAALTALQRPDMADVRVFDAAGKALPVALLGPAATAQRVEHKVSAWPVIGRGGAASSGGVALTIGADNVARVVGIAGAPGQEGVIAALLDTRKIADPAVGISLDADVPTGQPTEFTLEASSDLKAWYTMNTAVLFRPTAGAPTLGAANIALGGDSLKNRYVRIGWAGAGVSLRGATITTSASGVAPSVTIAAASPQLVSPRDLRFDLGFAPGPAALQIALSGDDGVVPFRLMGRNNPELPWQPLAAGVVRQSDAGGSMVGLSGPALRHYRIEADERSAGFSAPPRLELRFEPAELLVAFSGKPPYRLAAGLAQAPARFLTPEEIAPGVTGRLASLPRVRTPVAKDVSVSVAPAGDGDGTRKFALWAILILAVLVLGYAVIRLMRRQDAPAPQ